LVDKKWTDNLYSNPVHCTVRVQNGAQQTVRLTADLVISNIPPKDTEWVKPVELRSPLLSAFYLNAAVELLSDFLQTTDYGGYVEILPGDHGDVLTKSVRERIDKEIAEHFRATLKMNLPANN
jgi:hypothetical protein